MQYTPSLFTEDTYDTPETTRCALGARLFGRWYFYWHCFDTFRRTGACGRAGKLDAAMQVRLSDENTRLLERCGGKLHIRGMHNLRSLEGRPAVLVSNHMSLLETAMLHSIIRPYLDFAFVIKTSLFKVPAFGDIMRSLNSIPVGRVNPREDFKTVMTEGQKLLHSGRSIILFPQATRSEVLNPEHFNTIGIKLARAAGVPILPFALKTDFLGNGRLCRDLGPMRRDRQVYFDFFEPEMVIGNGREQHEKIVARIAERLNAWNAAEGRPATAPVLQG